MFRATIITVRLDGMDAAIINDMRRARGVKRMTPEMLAVNKQRDLVRARNVCNDYFKKTMGDA